MSLRFVPPTLALLLVAVPAGAQTTPAPRPAPAATQAATTADAHRYFGVDPVPLGENPLAFFKNPAPTANSAPDVDIQRDETPLKGGKEGYVDLAFRSSCTSSPVKLSYLWCGLFQLQNYTKTPETPGPVAENTALEAQLVQHGTGPGWAFLAETLDVTGKSDPRQPIYAEELDYRGLGTDKLRQRAITRMYISGPNGNDKAPMEIAVGLELNAIAPQTQRYLTGIHMNAPMQIAYDCYDATLSGACLRLKDNQGIQMSTDNQASFAYNADHFVFLDSGGSVLSIGAKGPDKGVVTALKGISAPAVTATASLTEPFGTPASSAAPCAKGQVTNDAGFHYVCVTTNHWKRAALADF